MVEFNPELRLGNVPDFTNAPGRLIDQSGYGELFAKTAVNVSETVGNVMDTNATNDISKSMRSVWDEATTKDAAEKAGIPVEVAQSMDKFTLYQKAIEKGGVSQSNAFAKMDAELKRLIAKYPNRADEIQQAYAKATGNTPANDMYKEAATQWDEQVKEQRRQQNDLQQDFNTWSEWMNEGDPEKFFTATSSERTRMINDAAVRKQANNKIEIIQNQLAWRKANNEDVTNDSKPAFVNAIDTKISLMFRGGEKKILKMIADAQADKNISQDEQIAITAEIEKAKTDLTSTFDGMLSTPFGSGEKKTTWNQIFANDPSIIEKQRERINGYVGMLNDLISNPQNTGIAQWTTTVNEAHNRDYQAAFLKTNLGQQYDRIKNIAEVGGKPLEKYFQETIPQIMDGIDKGQPETRETIMSKIIAGQLTLDMLTGDKTLNKSIEDGTTGATTSEKAAANPGIRAFVETSLKTVMDPSADSAAWEKAANYLFTSDNAKFFAKLSPVENQYGISQQELAFQAFTDPKVAKAFKDHGKEKQYYEAILAWSQPVLGSLPEDIRGRAGVFVGSGNIGNKAGSSRFNPATMQFEFRVDPSKVKDMSALRSFMVSADKSTWSMPLSSIDEATGLSYNTLQDLRAMSKATQRINLVLKAQADALKAQGMSNDQIIAYMQENLGDTDPGKQDPLIKAIIPMMKSAITQTASDKRTYGEDFGQNPQGTATELNVLEGTGSKSATGTTPDTGDDTANEILGFIHGAEGADYNTVFGGGKVDAGSMTVADVLARKDNAGSSAFGAVQVMKDTLQGLVKKGVVSPTDPMNQATQDRIGMALMKEAGYDDWKAGKISTSAFADKLSAIWASLPGKDGKSKYESDGVNKARVSRRELLGMLEDLRG